MEEDYEDALPLNNVEELQRELKATSELFATTGVALFKKIEKISSALKRYDKQKKDETPQIHKVKEEILEEFFARKKNYILDVIKELNLSFKLLEYPPIVKALKESPIQITYHNENELKFVLKWRLCDVEIQYPASMTIVKSSQFPIMTEISYNDEGKRFIVPKKSECFQIARSIFSGAGIIWWFSRDTFLNTVRMVFDNDLTKGKLSEVSVFFLVLIWQSITEFSLKADTWFGMDKLDFELAKPFTYNKVSLEDYLKQYVANPKKLIFEKIEERKNEHDILQITFTDSIDHVYFYYNPLTKQLYWSTF